MIVGGDFNCLLLPEERQGSRPFVYLQGSLEMDAAVTELDLQELGFTGSAFTWCNNQPGLGRVLGRLDRVFVNSIVLDVIPLGSVRHLPRVGSDHCPLLLALGHVQNARQSRWIRFEDTWLSYPMLRKLVSRSLLKVDVGDSVEVLQRKCRRTLQALFFWSKNKLQDLGAWKEILEAEIVELQRLESLDGGISEEQTQTLIAEVKDLLSIHAQLATWWKQHAKVELGNGSLVDNPEGIEAAFLDFFDRKWEGTAPILAGWPLLPSSPRLDGGAASLLLTKVSEEKIWGVIKAMKANRAPGLDSITSSFFVHFWPIVHTSVCRDIGNFFALGHIPSAWKETLVVLIPKCPNASRPDWFRPISLCQTIYKCFIAQEVVHKLAILTSATGFLAMKVDMEQAYDKMSWETLRQVLAMFGFPVEFARWILQCVEGPQFALLLNGRRVCTWTGKRINKSKSMVMFGKSTPTGKCNRLTRRLGFFRVREFTYLGITLAMRKLKRSDFSHLLLKVAAKVWAWGNRHLSLAGWATLIRSALLATPMFLYTHCHVPRKVHESFERLARFFLWQRAPSQCGMHYVSWEQCCSPSTGVDLASMGVNAAGILPFPQVSFGPVHWPSLAGGDHPTRFTGLAAHQGGRCMPLDRYTGRL
ncbi:hypothetical protein KSP39_PZI013102 [Platanthera zijinensis]|uniref:Reverse transcriptase domain-containing protein n=1 Tax=Platanthera zijinensis TaxID=2320716 RepID=A0AAP0BDQ0_9ASPA